MNPKGKMGIPAVRRRLVDLAGDMALGGISQLDAADQILKLLPHLRRNKWFDSERRIHRPVTFEIAVACWRMHRTGLTCHEIGERLGVDGGRVSEVLHGLRFPDAKDA